MIHFGGRTFIAESGGFVAAPQFQEVEPEEESGGLSKTGVALIAVFTVVLVMALAFAAFKVSTAGHYLAQQAFRAKRRAVRIFRLFTASFFQREDIERQKQRPQCEEGREKKKIEASIFSLLASPPPWSRLFALASRSVAIRCARPSTPTKRLRAVNSPGKIEGCEQSRKDRGLWTVQER